MKFLWLSIVAIYLGNSAYAAPPTKEEYVKYYKELFGCLKGLGEAALMRGRVKYTGLDRFATKVEKIEDTVNKFIEAGTTFVDFRDGKLREHIEKLRSIPHNLTEANQYLTTVDEAIADLDRLMRVAVGDESKYLSKLRNARLTLERFRAVVAAVTIDIEGEARKFANTLSSKKALREALDSALEEENVMAFADAVSTHTGFPLGAIVRCGCNIVDGIKKLYAEVTEIVAIYERIDEQEAMYRRTFMHDDMTGIVRLARVNGCRIAHDTDSLASCEHACRHDRSYFNFGVWFGVGDKRWYPLSHRFDWDHKLEWVSNCNLGCAAKHGGGTDSGICAKLWKDHAVPNSYPLARFKSYDFDKNHIDIVPDEHNMILMLLHHLSKINESWNSPLLEPYKKPKPGVGGAMLTPQTMRQFIQRYRNNRGSRTQVSRALALVHAMEFLLASRDAVEHQGEVTEYFFRFAETAAFSKARYWAKPGNVRRSQMQWPGKDNYMARDDVQAFIREVKGDLVEFGVHVANLETDHPVSQFNGECRTYYSLIARVESQLEESYSLNTASKNYANIVNHYAVYQALENRRPIDYQFTTAEAISKQCYEELSDWFHAYYHKRPVCQNAPHAIRDHVFMIMGHHRDDDGHYSVEKAAAEICHYEADKALGGRAFERRQCGLNVNVYTGEKFLGTREACESLDGYFIESAIGASENLLTQMGACRKELGFCHCGPENSSLALIPVRYDRCGRPSCYPHRVLANGINDQPCFFDSNYQGPYELKPPDPLDDLKTVQLPPPNFPPLPTGPAIGSPEWNRKMNPVPNIGEIVDAAKNRQPPTLFTGTTVESSVTTDPLGSTEDLDELMKLWTCEAFAEAHQHLGFVTNRTTCSAQLHGVFVPLDENEETWCRETLYSGRIDKIEAGFCRCPQDPEVMMERKNCQEALMSLMSCEVLDAFHPQFVTNRTDCSVLLGGQFIPLDEAETTWCRVTLDNGTVDSIEAGFCQCPQAESPMRDRIHCDQAMNELPDCNSPMFGINFLPYEHRSRLILGKSECESLAPSGLSGTWEPMLYPPPLCLRNGKMVEAGWCNCRPGFEEGYLLRDEGGACAQNNASF